MNRRKFITTCACCAFAGGAPILLNKKRINTKSNDFLMSHVMQIHITEHCNLKCKYCYHFSCIAEEEFYDLDKFKNDIRQMSKIFNKKLFYLQLLGGEPLLNPQINEYVKISRKYFPGARIAILTNATLLDDMDESFWKTLNENAAYIVASIYPITINWKSILNKAKIYNVEVCALHECEESKITLDNIEKFRIKTFYKQRLKTYRSYVTKSGCGLSFDSMVMQNGKLYPCVTIAYIRHLNKKFNTDFTVSEGDYLDLYKVKDINEVKEFINKPVLPFCEYHIRKPDERKWENSAVHTIDEWVDATV